MIAVIWVLGGCVSGVLIGYFFGYSRAEKIRDIRRSLTQLSGDYVVYSENVKALKDEVAQLTSRADALKTACKERASEAEEWRKLADQFQVNISLARGAAAGLNLPPKEWREKTR